MASRKHTLFFYCVGAKENINIDKTIAQLTCACGRSILLLQLLIFLFICRCNFFYFIIKNMAYLFKELILFDVELYWSFLVFFFHIFFHFAIVSTFFHFDPVFLCRYIYFCYPPLSWSLFSLFQFPWR